MFDILNVPKVKYLVLTVKYLVTAKTNSLIWRRLLLVYGDEFFEFLCFGIIILGYFHLHLLQIN